MITQATKPWPVWKMIGAYIALSIAALAAVWYVDRAVPRASPGAVSTGPSAGRT